MCKKYSSEILIFSFFALLSLLVTLPVVFYPRTYVYAQFPGDPHGTLWGIWWTKLSWVANISFESCQILGAPFGLQMYKWTEPVMSFPIFVLSLLLDEIFAYNVMAIAGFLLSAITMYYLVYHLTTHSLASMVSGIIYAFSPYHFAQSYAHIGLSNIQWMPLYVLFLLKFYEERTIKNALLCGLSFSLVVLENGYYAFFMFISTIAFLFFIFIRNLIRQKKLDINIRRWKLPILSVLFSLVLLVPFALPVAYQQFAGPSPHITALWEVESLTAKSWSYLLPAVDNPVFGRFVEDFVYTETEGRYSYEHVNYLGYVPLALAALAVVLWQKKKFLKEDEIDERLTWGIPFFIFAFFVAVICSAPPSVSIFGSKIPMPSYYLHEVAPMFRAFIRFGVVAMLALSVLAGIGLKFLLENIASTKNQLLATILLIFLVLAEFINVPPSKATNVAPETIPPVYKWLASQPGDFTIVEYPVPTQELHKYYAWAFYQRIHRKKMADPRAIPALEGKDYLYNILFPYVPSILKYLGVKYVIIHLDEYRKSGGTIPIIPPNSGMRLVKVFPDTFVYELKAKPSKVLWVKGDNFFSSDFFGGWWDFQKWTWMSDDGKLQAVNFTGRDIYGNVRFSARALGHPRSLRIQLNGKFLKQIEVSPSVTEGVLEDVHLKAGENTFVFSTDSTPETIDLFLHNGDVRPASFMFLGFEFEG